MLDHASNFVDEGTPPEQILLAVSEDLARKTAPDVAFHFNVITRA